MVMIRGRRRVIDVSFKPLCKRVCVCTYKCAPRPDFLTHI